MAGRFHILIVDDESLIIEVLQATLESEYLVSSATTKREALAFLRTSNVDLVLVDNLLPDGRGAEVARVAADLGVAVIEMSGYPQAVVGLERSGRPYLLKPFGENLMLSTIRRVLQTPAQEAESNQEM